VNTLKQWSALVREGSWVIVGQIAAAVGSVVVTCLLARWLEPSEYGVFALALTASTFGQNILFGPWAGSAMRFDSLAVSEGASRSFLAMVYKVQWQLSMVGTMILVLVLLGLLVSNHHDVVLLSIATAIAVIAAAWTTLAGSLQSARRQRSIIAMHQGITPWIRLVMVMAVIRMFQPSASLAMTGWALANIVVSLSQWRYIPWTNLAPDRQDHPQYRIRLISYAAPFILWGVFSFAQSSVDRWSLRAATNMATVGIYSAAYQLGYAPALLLGAFVEQMLVPVAFAGAGNALDEKRLHQARRRVFIAAIALLIVAFFGAGLVWLCEPIIKRVLPAAYAQCAAYVAPLFMAGGLFAVAQVLIIAPLTSFNSKSILVPRMLTSLAAVVIFVYASYTWGLPGLIAGQLIVSLIFCTWFAIIAMRRQPAVTSGSG
jgi:O-antigen/teichoic acid export membrane protein